MPLLKYNDRSVFFIHIPKTSGSSFYEGMATQGITSTFLGSSQHWLVRKYCSRQHYHIDLLEQFFPDYKLHNPFAIIRDPWHRICSEYVWVTRNNDKDPWYWFDGWLYKQLSAFITKPYTLDNHIRPQHHFINDHVRVFVYNRREEAEYYINQQLNYTFDFSTRKNEFKYDRPDLSILSKDTFNLWRSTYLLDIEMFNDLQ